MSSDSATNSIFLARQPIFGKDLTLFAYELLFRNNQNNQSGVNNINGDEATTQVINHTFLEFGIERVLGNKRGFINLTRAFLLGDIPLPFDHQDVVLEILEDIIIDDDIIQAVKNFSEQGFIIALDDFIYNDNLKPLIHLADIIKIDLLALSERGLAEHVELLRPFQVKLLAEKVETEAQFEQCKALGFDYYQGYFFCKPVIIDDKPLPDNKIAVLRILSELQRSDITIIEIDRLVRQDISLSFKLLRSINSAAFALPKKIDSIKQAVLYLGLDSIKSWATIIVFCSIDSPTSQELMMTALVRAKMSEILAPVFECDSETGFMLGLFSVADALFKKPMSELLKSLPLSDTLKLALQSAEGPEGRLLTFIQSHERGTLVDMPNTLKILTINQAFMTATNWATQSLNSIK